MANAKEQACELVGGMGMDQARHYAAKRANYSLALARDFARAGQVEQAGRCLGESMMFTDIALALRDMRRA